MTPVFTSFEWVDEKLNLQETEKSEGVGGGGKSIMDILEMKEGTLDIRHKTRKN